MIEQRFFKSEAMHGEVCVHCGEPCHTAISTLGDDGPVGPFCSWHCLDDWEMEQDEEPDDAER